MTSPLEKLAEATESADPGGFIPGEFLREPVGEGEKDGAVPGLILDEMTDAGWVFLYDTVSFVASRVNNNMKSEQLKALRADGTKVFTEVKPGEPWRGTVKCFLHPDQPNHGALMAMGFKSCSKSNMPNPFEAGEHARHRHTTWWKAFQDKEERLRNDEDRELQREIARGMSRRGSEVEQPQIPLNSSESPVEAVVAVAVAPTVETPAKKRSRKPQTPEQREKMLANLAKAREARKPK